MVVELLLFFLKAFALIHYYCKWLSLHFRLFRPFSQRQGGRCGFILLLVSPMPSSSSALSSFVANERRVEYMEWSGVEKAVKSYNICSIPNTSKKYMHICIYSQVFNIYILAFCYVLACYIHAIMAHRRPSRFCLFFLHEKKLLSRLDFRIPPQTCVPT